MVLTMHELSVTENLLEIALRHAQQANAKRIIRLHLVVGQLSSIIDDSVNFYWDIIAKGTIAETAELEFRRIPATFECLDCHTQYIPESDHYECSHCNSANVRLIKGQEFFLESMDVE